MGSSHPVAPDPADTLFKGRLYCVKGDFMNITPDLKQAVERAGDEPVRLEDPETHLAYVLVKEEVYQRLREAFGVEKVDPSFYEFGDFVPLDER